MRQLCLDLCCLVINDLYLNLTRAYILKWDGKRSERSLDELVLQKAIIWQKDVMEPNNQWTSKDNKERRAKFASSLNPSMARSYLVADVAFKSVTKYFWRCLAMNYT